ncbi:MAG: adenylate/guanylate cyclase domain-containing protein [Thermoleophilaceae bacterium]
MAGEASTQPTGPEPTTEHFRQLLQTLDTGVAVADPDTLTIAFENARFFGWFDPDPEVEDTLERRLPGLDVDRLRSRLEKGRSYSFDAETGSGARKATIAVTLRACGLDGDEYVIAECVDVSKRKEAEYMLDSYARMAEKNTREVQREKERAEKLLLNIMPRAVYEEMKDFGSVTPARFDNATILMLDFAGFTDMAVSRDPGSLVSELNDIFSAFDRIVELFGCERMKTIGDAYMAVAGMPEETEEHAQAIARVALRMRRYLEKRNTSHREPWLGRIGINSGPIVGSIVGVQKYVYDIFGPGVNLAARMEAVSEPMKITISESTFEAIKQEFICSDLGEVEVKGFGVQRLYSLDGEVARGR